MEQGRVDGSPAGQGTEGDAAGDEGRRPGSDGEGGTSVRHAHLLEAISGTALRMYYQPLIELDGGRTVAYEALARFNGHPDVTPDGWFRRAAEVGLREELELTAVDCALRALSDLREEVAVCVNVSRHGIMAPGLAERLEGLPLDRVILELTEQEEVTDYMAMNRALLRMRADGLRLAVDDAGAGFASMRHIVSLQPDMIKLDATWVMDIEADPVRRAMVTALATFASEIDAVIVGEAVETAAQAAVLREIGVPLAQGYFFARPAPLVA